MEVILAKSAGFCFGVDRAVKSVYDNIDDKPLYTYGPIIHNLQVVEELEDKGVKVINDIEELPNLPKGKVIIRSHGVEEKIYNYIRDNGFSIIDATCPYVKKIHRIVNDYSKEGDTIIIIGDPSHPEVIGIKGWSSSKAIIIESIEDAKKLQLPIDEHICIVAQTTLNYLKFQEIIEIFLDKGYHVDIKDTICRATRDRQEEAIQLSGKVDKMIVIGGKHSSNTRKLYQLCKNQCDNTYHIETIEDLELLVFSKNEIIGITAGASTPKNIIQEVITHVRSTE
ncbi:4-hydroxy-3-methylbut-2-enyl diphosphate reductase [Vallitalea sp.]|jgi:4-hydroxy-3-methylbut-2-enyl diphosphate reductase|uniref:4-hydroxy-3-methylbut-2-enyl diphosphate reductase n=1 Tax=Vallitalea sp. TaxID=1882829 RepID=UPI0025F90ACE|nr:4-hydroxy-3-methylbut-2-enyl diphosphate reductase [Vallitalea sp.]MCT4688319.1 4-hydroxy-3-methylbut-2-enyl diphosphate reductase [Vallitalea sp.]